MPTLEFETTVAAPMGRVWAFYEDVAMSLPALTSPGEGLKVESADTPVREGSRIILTMNGPVGRVRWVAKIVTHVPPHAVVFGEEARFVDEQEEGPFRKWVHHHEFEAVDAKTTRIVDRIEYRVPFGPLGVIANFIYVHWKLKRAFRYRHEMLWKRFGRAG